jgi:uncharacterized membrane protein HdeD (DUF308 family)
MTERAELIDRGEVAPSWGWWLLVLIGIVSVVAGGILVAKPSHSLATLSVIFGIFLLIDGIVDVASSFGRGEENRALTAIFGLLAIVIGILLIRHPTSAVSAIGLIIGIWLVAAGALRLLRAFAFGGHVVLRVLIALLEIVVGVIVVSDPHIGYATLAILLGIWLIINGLAWIGLGIVVRAAR